MDDITEPTNLTPDQHKAWIYAQECVNTFEALHRGWTHEQIRACEFIPDRAAYIDEHGHSRCRALPKSRSPRTS